MCGLAGVFASGGRSPEELERIALRVSGAIAHRGPDDHGVWVDSAAGVALGFGVWPSSISPRRVTSRCDPRAVGFIIIFNGEEFAAAVVDVLRNGELRTRLEREGRHTVETHYAWSVVGARLNAAYHELIHSGRS